MTCPSCEGLGHGERTRAICRACNGSGLVTSDPMLLTPDEIQLAALQQRVRELEALLGACTCTTVRLGTGQLGINRWPGCPVHEARAQVAALRTALAQIESTEHYEGCDSSGELGTEDCACCEVCVASSFRARAALSPPAAPAKPCPWCERGFELRRGVHVVPTHIPEFPDDERPCAAAPAKALSELVAETQPPACPQCRGPCNGHNDAPERGDDK